MNLDELERLAREAAQTETWWNEHLLRYHLRVADGTCPECDPPLMAACSPSVILRLVEIAKAAESLRFLMDRDNCIIPCAEFTALRAALSAAKGGKE